MLIEESVGLNAPARAVRVAGPARPSVPSLPGSRRRQQRVILGRASGRIPPRTVGDASQQEESVTEQPFKQPEGPCKTQPQGKEWGGLPSFDPEAGTIVREPDGASAGFWVGAPTVYHDSTDGRYYLSYRVRRPRPERGVENRIAVSDDGESFEDIYTLHKDALGSESIER